MTNFAKLTLEDFSTALASDAPTPGGGTAAATAGAMGAALAEMVAALTLSKEKYAASHDAVRPIAEAGRARTGRVPGSRARGLRGLRRASSRRAGSRRTPTSRRPRAPARDRPRQPARRGGPHADRPRRRPAPRGAARARREGQPQRGVGRRRRGPPPRRLRRGRALERRHQPLRESRTPRSCAEMQTETAVLQEDVAAARARRSSLGSPCRTASDGRDSLPAPSSRSMPAPSP